ncbi:MAG: flagellar motor switch protein FliM [Aeromicrobium sp.]|nr:flagellar motor switch protein FliM [Burkholderiales bacterium]
MSAQQQFLSQDEVDALLDGMNGAEKNDAVEAPAAGIREYDIANQERIVRGRMPTLEIINERFARNFRIGLFNFMRRTPEMAVGQVRVLKYSAFLRDVVVPTNINIVSVRPLRGSGLVILDPKLVFTVIDSMFGGTGRFQTRIEGREFTATEQRIIQKLLDVVTTEYAKAWQGVYPLQLEHQRSEMHTQFANIATPSEIMVTTKFSLEIGDAGGDVFICIPYSTLEPIRDLLYSSLQGDATSTDKRWLALLTKQVQMAEIDLVAELGSTNITVGDLLQMTRGDFIELPLKETIQAKVDGVPLFDCKYGTLNNHYSIKIDTILTIPQENSAPSANAA